VSIGFAIEPLPSNTATSRSLPVGQWPFPRLRGLSRQLVRGRGNAAQPQLAERPDSFPQSSRRRRRSRSVRRPGLAGNRV